MLKACIEHTHTHTADTDVAIDSTQQAAAAASVEPYSSVVYIKCIHIYSIKQIAQFTNSNVMRESKLSVLEWHTKACI